MQLHYIGVVRPCQNLPLGLDPLHAVVLEDEVFADLFHCADLAVLLVTDEEHVAESAVTYEF